MVFVKALVEQQILWWRQLVNFITQGIPLGPDNFFAFHDIGLLKVLTDKFLEKRIFNQVYIDVLILKQDVFVKFTHILKIKVGISEGSLLKWIPKKVLFSYFALFLFEMLEAHVEQIKVFRVSLLKLFE